VANEPQRLRVQASGMSFAALAWGSGDGPLALCLHGYPDTAWTWRHLGPHLAARGWRVVAPYMRGYAPTDLAPDGVYQIGALVRDALELHEALDGDDRAVVIGHDWGAEAAYGAGSSAPERFARVVTLAVPPAGALIRGWRSPLLGLRQLRHSWYMGFQQLPVISERALPRLIPRLWSDWSPGYDSREDVELVLEALRGEHATAALRYYRALIQPWAGRRYAAEQAHALRIPRKPLLYLHGRDDGCLLAEFAERTRELLGPDGEVEVVPDAGHFLQLERPQLVNDKIAQFIG
jgi:pimeloyl-ACP methyl ester carboxylesterase